LNTIAEFLAAVLCQSLVAASCFAAQSAPEGHGPLRVHPSNPRYLTDDGNRAIYLTGLHTWLDFQDGGVDYPPAPLDYNAYLDLLERHHHNFIRLWAWESAAWVRPDSSKLWLEPLPFARTGPGVAADGRPKFDLNKLNPAYFERLRNRVAAANDRNFYVGVMLFQGFSVSRKSRSRRETPWAYHPLHHANNINGINGDADGDGEGYEIHQLGNDRVTAIQETLVRKVVDILNEFDNVVFEIGNECHGASTAWQYHMLQLIHAHEKEMPKRHLTWMTYQWDGIAGRGTDNDLWRSPATLVSPSAGKDRAYEHAPPVADGTKIVIADTDHINPRDRDRVAWIWKCFTRGLHPIFMDNPPVPGCPAHPDFTNGPHKPSERTRSAMGVTRTIAETIDLANMTPTDDRSICSSGYCLTSPGREYVVWHDQQGLVRLMLPAGTFNARWIDPVVGDELAAERLTLRVRSSRQFKPPGNGPSVLHVKSLTKPQAKARRRVPVRLEMAANRLLSNRHDEITRIASNSGLSSSQNVTVHGDGPDFRGEVRENGTVPLAPPKGTGPCFRLARRKVTKHQPAEKWTSPP